MMELQKCAVMFQRILPQAFIGFFFLMGLGCTNQQAINPVGQWRLVEGTEDDKVPKEEYGFDLNADHTVDFHNMMWATISGDEVTSSALLHGEWNTASDLLVMSYRLEDETKKRSSVSVIRALSPDIMVLERYKPAFHGFTGVYRRKTD